MRRRSARRITLCLDLSDLSLAGLRDSLSKLQLASDKCLAVTELLVRELDVSAAQLRGHGLLLQLALEKSVRLLAELSSLREAQQPKRT